MAGIIIKTPIDMKDKIRMMQEDAVYDVADDEIPDDDDYDAAFPVPDAAMTNVLKIKAAPAPPKVPKVFLSNDCIFNCAYCGCRASHDGKERYCNTPKEMAEIAVRESKKTGSGIFLTSSIVKNADYTEELIIESLRIIREELLYKGYLHAKIMPGTDPDLIARAGRYANRLSVNIEVANSTGYDLIAKQKNKQNILTPMYQISRMIKQENEGRGFHKPTFATSQTTQLMAGSIDETDYTILNLSDALYKKLNLKRVYYTAFHYIHPAKGYDMPRKDTPKWRVRRLYQADRLMQLYGFQPEEIAPESAPSLTENMDPKMSWALRNLQLFPIEVNTASYETLLRIPGIGLTFAKRIVAARKLGTVTHDVLKKAGVSLKKSRYFLTCSGRYEGGDFLSQPELLTEMFKET